LNLELLVPAPTSPKHKMARFESSWSSSCANLTSKSVIVIFGFEMFSIAKPKGTALLTSIGQYYKTWLKLRMAISLPISSLVAIIAMEMMAACLYS